MFMLITPGRLQVTIDGTRMVCKTGKIGTLSIFYLAGGNEVKSWETEDDIF